MPGLLIEPCMRFTGEATRQPEGPFGRLLVFGVPRVAPDLQVPESSRAMGQANVGDHSLLPRAAANGVAAGGCYDRMQARCTGGGMTARLGWMSDERLLMPRCSHERAVGVGFAPRLRTPARGADGSWSERATDRDGRGRWLAWDGALARFCRGMPRAQSLGPTFQPGRSRQGLRQNVSVGYASSHSLTVPTRGISAGTGQGSPRRPPKTHTGKGGIRLGPGGDRHGGPPMLAA